VQRSLVTNRVSEQCCWYEVRSEQPNNTFKLGCSKISELHASCALLYHVYCNMWELLPHHPYPFMCSRSCPPSELCPLCVKRCCNTHYSLQKKHYFSSYFVSSTKLFIMVNLLNTLSGFNFDFIKSMARVIIYTLILIATKSNKFWRWKKHRDWQAEFSACTPCFELHQIPLLSVCGSYTQFF
jgi:hypothetical protein